MVEGINSPFSLDYNHWPQMKDSNPGLSTLTAGLVPPSFGITRTQGSEVKMDNKEGNPKLPSMNCPKAGFLALGAADIQGSSLSGGASCGHCGG